MGKGVPRAALLALAVLLLASSLASVGGARVSSTPIYTLVGYVEQPGGQPVPPGVTVILTSSATHQTYNTQIQTLSGQFTFSSNGNAPALTPGWWGLSVPPQAHVNQPGGPFAILPENQSVHYVYLNASALTTQTPVTLYNVARTPYNATINGTVTLNGAKQSGAEVELLAPAYNGFVLANNTTSTNRSHLGYFSISVPWGNWVLETVWPPGSPSTYNYSMAVVDAAALTKTNVTINPALFTGAGKNRFSWGYINLASSPSTHVRNGGNVTVYDPLTHGIFSGPTSPGGFYSFGTYGSQTFDVVLSAVDHSTVWYQLAVSPANPSGGSPHNVTVSSIAPSANYTTLLNWSKGFGKLNVTTSALLGNDSVFPDLANASVGQLWAQLALDWQHNVTFLASNLPQVNAWLASQGPFFPAGQAGTAVNGTGYGQPTNDTFTPSSTCATFCGLSSAASMHLTWTQNYNVTGKLPNSNKTFGVSFNFRHPTHAQAFNYTVILPVGYVLSAGNPVPAQSSLVPAGPGGTWTKFTLVSKPSPSASDTFSFKVVKIGAVTAAVNVTSKEFTWSAKNILNSTRTNFTAVAASGENLTFTGLGSTFPSNTNGTLFKWGWGDAHWTNTSNGTTNHTYGAPGTYAGSLTVVSSGGTTSTVGFKMYIGSQAPTATISVNDTKILQAPNSIPYIIVNWSTPLRFNASMSTSTLNAGPGAPKGVLSVALWNITNGKSQTFNRTRTAGANPLDNISTSFVGQGRYLTQGSANHTAIPGSFFGWQYNVTLTVWDYGGHNATTEMVVLVKDTQKPTPSVTLKSANGKVLPTSGIVEAANHTAQVVFSSVNSTDANNGSIVWYNWSIGNAQNHSANQTVSLPAASPNYPMPAPFSRWLAPQGTPYTVNLTVTDRAGNKAWATTALTVAVNTSTRPVLSVGNLTTPTTMTDGSAYTVWANVTNLFGRNSTAMSVTVRLYLLAPGGTGSPSNIGGSPTSVQFYNVSNGKVGALLGTGSVNLKWNQTVRAQIQFTPARTGTWDLWVNATAANEFPSNYKSGGNQAHVTVTLNQNPIVLDEEYAGVGAAVVIVIVGLVYYFRRRVAKPAGKGTSGGKLERGSSGGGKKDEDEE
ncbi:MAG: PKD domain-containing protein [Thermoplasmata archaeon]|nr:PKD domain-containing protein [Thermoplasmata archaeon]